MKNPEDLWIRASRLKGSGIISRASRHILREIAKEIGDYGSINSKQTHLNKILRGASRSAAVVAEADVLMAEAGVGKLRKDAVLVVEIVVSLKKGFRVDEDAYFSETVEWAQKYFNVPILSAVVHNDQPQPHIHMLLMPIVGGRMRGSELVGSPYKQTFMARNFFDVVGVKHGLTLPNFDKKKSKPTVGFAGELGAKPTVGFACESDAKPYLCRFHFKPLSKQERMELLTYQFTEGIRQKIAASNRGWVN